MFGVAINAVGVLAGGIMGSLKRAPISPADEPRLKVFLGAATVLIGLHLTWRGLNGSFGSVMKQLFIVLLALSLGKFIGRSLRLQKFSNSIGKYATDKLTNLKPDEKRFSDGFIVASLLACANPLGIFAAVDEGLNGFSGAFLSKAVMDGLVALSFKPIFGWSVFLAIIPLVAWQGTIVLLARYWQPFLAQQELINSINATNGLLIFCVSLIILNLKKIELADYLPSLAMAPIITYLWR
ncbi:MAG: DUF554 family protein [Verrucomicrobia bacterium]|nr:DUF554 family protein [Verrucomicrobiota bacterium]